MEITFNKEIEAMAASTSVVLMEKARAMKAQGKNVIDLTGGDPDFDTPAAAENSAIKAMLNGNTHYVAGAGIPELRIRVARQLREEQNISCSENNIFITPGGKYAIYLLVRVLLNRGEEVLIPQPSWVSYTSIVQAAGGKAIEIPLSFDDGYRLNTEILEKYVTSRTKLLILNSPNNPNGHVLSKEEIEEIDEFAKKHNLVVLSDEIYSSLCYGETKYMSFGAVKEALSHVVIVNGFSKSAAMTGWRVGYICASTEILAQVKKLYQHTMTCIPGFSQAAALRACDCKQELVEMRQQYQTRLASFIGKLQKIEGIDIRMPEGAFYAWMRVRRGKMSDLELCDYLLQEAGVAGIPGSAFGEKGAYVRFSCAASLEDLMEAAERLTKALEKL